VRKDRGYIESYDNMDVFFESYKGDGNVISVSNNFSAVERVSFRVEPMRAVDSDKNCERLVLDVDTDGSISSVDSVRLAAGILVKQFSLIAGDISIGDVTPVEQSESSSNDKQVYSLLYEKLSQNIDDLELTVRSRNCLSFADIETVYQLIVMDEFLLMKLPNFGRKSFKEIEEVLSVIGLSLGMEIPQKVIDKLTEKP